MKNLQAGGTATSQKFQNLESGRRYYATVQAVSTLGTSASVMSGTVELPVSHYACLGGELCGVSWCTELLLFFCQYFFIPSLELPTFHIAKPLLIITRAAHATLGTMTHGSFISLHACLDTS